MKAKYSYFLYIILTFIIGQASNFVLKIDNLFYNSLNDKLTSKQIEDVLQLQDKWQWLGYVFIPFYFLLKTIIITSVVYIGVFFFSKMKITFKQVFDKILVAEFIFLAVPILKVIWFYFFQPDYTLLDIQSFYPLSALNIIDNKELDSYLLYPLQTLNVFEITYIIYLSYQIGYLTKTSPDNGLKIVSYSYIPAMLLWITVIMFFTLNYS